MAGYFYTQNKQKRGPVSSAQLKQLAVSGQLQPSDQVMKEGSNKWVPAGSVKGLFPEQAAAATATVAAAVATPEEEPPRSRAKLWLGMVVVLGALAAGGFFLLPSKDKDKAGDKGGGGSQAKSKNGGGSASTNNDDPESPENAKLKLAAWNAFVEEFTVPVDDEAARDAHLEKCQKLLEEYRAIPFDPQKFAKEARQILQSYRIKGIERLYPFWEPRKQLNKDIQEMSDALLRVD